MSSSEIAVSVRGLGKSYTIAHQAADTPNTMAEALIARLRRPLRRTPKQTFWALKDVEFDIKVGDVVGIVGRNGAGKSTLLKLLSRITEPTTGYIDLVGRVGSLLEVGTGFHPELTGRENVFLNGAILGMTKAEIRKQFDAIVNFAGVEQFLDTPVKRYSSGMYVRLAFAVAAHLSSDILIVDEVLAVGDTEFQKKCLGKMGEVAQDGRTVLFVSHNMAAIENLCSKAVFLQKGRFTTMGDCAEVIHQYLTSNHAALRDDGSLADKRDRSGTGDLVLTSFHIEDESGSRLHAVSSGMDVQFVLGFDCPHGRVTQEVDIGISVQTEREQLLFVFYASYIGKSLRGVPARGEFRCRIPRLPLAAGNYLVGARVLVGGEEADWPRNGVGTLSVEAGDFWGAGSSGFAPTAPLLIDAGWTVTDQGSERPTATLLGSKQSADA